ncbi:hypothetical protein NDU88_008553 [Pleurodeles waltl]|uniref:Uncharacterized protein n=1 Tax=Pleurodeles waltl TaxID=8319 RepID=A0AAV7PPG2_PLEWA|nr:hypothetical protein NDU88_008553 [Pleurodeles waltl]
MRHRAGGISHSSAPTASARPPQFRSAGSPHRVGGRHGLPGRRPQAGTTGPPRLPGSSGAFSPGRGRTGAWAQIPRGSSPLPRTAPITSRGAAGPVSAQPGAISRGRHFVSRVSWTAARTRGLGSSIAHHIKRTKGSWGHEDVRSGVFHSARPH